jgi:prevent-host-death family protein
MTMVADHGRGRDVGEMTIKASEFKAKCLKLMDEVQRTGDAVIITKNGRPVARLESAGPARRPLRGLHKGRAEILGDIISPLDVEWEVNS